MPLPALLEREEPLRILRSRLAEAASGSGAMVLVGGEAGIGKSALAQHLCETAADSVQVLIGACDPMDTPRPLGPLLDMAPRLGSPIRGLLERGSRDPLFRHLLDALRQRPTIMVLEDVHWADDATLDLLRFLGRRLDTTRALTVVTYRRDEVGPRHPLKAALGDLSSTPGVIRMNLRPLSRDAVARLSHGIDIEPDDLHRLTDGNPFFVTEVVAAGGERLPASIGDAIAARLTRHPSDARTALETASVIGPSMEPALLSALGTSTETIEACLAGGLLVERAGRLTFRHELTRVAILDAISAPRRRECHAAVLSTLERTPALGTDHATLAHHAAEAGDADAVLRYAPSAARRAAALGAHREARAQFARALPYLERLPDSEHTELLEAYAHECELTDHLAESARAWHEVIERWRATGDTERWANALTRLAGTHVTMGDNAAANAASAASIEALEALGPSHDLVRAYWQRAHLLMMDRATAASLEWGFRAIDLASQLEDVHSLAGAHMTVACSLMLSGDARYVEHFECSESLARRHGLHQVLVGTLGNRGSGAGELYRFSEAEHFLREALDVSAEHDFDRQHVYGLAWLALTRLFRGAWDEATSLITQVLGRSTESAVARIMALAALGRLRVRRGDPEAWPPLDEALELALATGTLQRLAPVRAARAEAAWFDGDLDRVRSEAAASFELAVQARHPWFVGELGYWRFLAGDLDELPPFAAEPFVLQVRGRHRDAAAAWETLGCPFETARALAESPAEQDVRDAIDAFTRLGARVAAERARTRLRELGATRVPLGPRERTQRHPAGLTPREAQVLSRLVEGLSNAQIAERHRVSTRTVEHQVSAVLAKLGVESRAAAVREAYRRGLVPPM